MPRLCKTYLAVGSLAIGLIACAGAGQSQAPESTAASVEPTPASQPATGVCRAFLVGGPVDLGRQAILLERSGEDPAELIEQTTQALDEVASGVSGTGPDVDAFNALAAAVNAGEPFEGLLEGFFDTYAEDCGVNIVRH
jgi:hypothetical protein